MKLFCGSENQILTFNPLNLTLPGVNDEYGFANLYCRWRYHNKDPKQAIAFYFRNLYNKLSRFIFSLEIMYIDGRVLYHTIDQETFVWDSEGLSVITLHFYTAKAYAGLPFILEMDYTTITSPTNIGLFVSLAVVFLACLACSVCFYKCSRIIVRNANRRNNERRAQLAVIHLRNNSLPESEEVTKKNNKLFIEKLFEQELKPQKYSDKINEFKATCTICIEAFTDDSQSTVLFCKHIFHPECLKDWLMKNLIMPKCPNCNFNLLEHLGSSNDSKVEMKIEVVSNSSSNFENRTNYAILQGQRANVRIQNNNNNQLGRI
jgi:hypothetical protein